MLAQNDEYLQAAATSIRIANEAEMIREHCRARENASLQSEIASLRKQLAEFQAQTSKSI